MPQSGTPHKGQGEAGVCRWKTSGSTLIVLLIELEMKQLSLAFSRIRGMRGRSLAKEMTILGFTVISVI